MSAAGTLIAGAFKFVAGAVATNLTAKATRAQGAAARIAALKNASNIEEHADFVQIQTEEEAKRYARSAERILGAARATIGASGLRVTGISATLRENAKTIQQDLDLIRLAGAREVKNLRNEAELIRETGIANFRLAQQIAKSQQTIGLLSGFAELIGGSAKAISAPGGTLSTVGSGLTPIRRRELRSVPATSSFGGRLKRR